MKKHKISKLYIGAFLYKFAFLLLAFIVETFFLSKAGSESVYTLYAGTGALLVLLVFWSVALYKKAEFCENKSCFSLAKGLILRRKSVIRKDRIHLRSYTRKVPYLFFNAAELTLVTSRFQSSVFLNKNAAKNLADIQSDKKTQTEEVLSSSGFFSTLVTCASFSNTLTGLLTLIPILRNTATLMGRDKPLELLTQLPLEDFIIFRFLPSSLRILASLLLILWLWGLVGALEKLCCFRSMKSGNLITLQHGLLTRKSFTFHLSKITALSLRQNILPFLLQLYSCVAYIPSENRQKALPLALAKSKRQQKELLNRLGLTPHNLLFSIVPERGSLWGYLYLPFIYLSVVSLACIIPSFLPFYPLLYPLLFPLLVLFGVGWILLRFAGFRRTNIKLYDNMLCICGFRGFTMEENYLPPRSLRGIEIRESLFQRLHRRCTLVIYVKSSSRLTVPIRHINKEKAAQLCNLCGFNYSLYSIKSEG